MGVLITILIIAALVGGVWWNHQNAKKAMEGVSFVVPFGLPPRFLAFGFVVLLCTCICFHPFGVSFAENVTSSATFVQVFFFCGEIL